MLARFVAILLPAILLVPLSLKAQQKQAEFIGGKIVSAVDHRPLPHATLTLREGTSPQIASATTSDEEGNFRFDAVPAGRYHLSASAHGYLYSDYQEHDQYSTAIVTGAGLDTGSLVMELNPAGRISGRISDENGDPSERALLTLYVKDPVTHEIRRNSATQSRDDGQYEFERLGTGTYFVSVSATPWYAIHPPQDADRPGTVQSYRPSIDPALDVAYPVMFFSNVTDSKDASPIVLQAGEEAIANVQLVPQQAYTVAITPETDGANQPAAGNLQLTHTVFGKEEPLVARALTFNGKQMLMSGIPSGEYHVVNGRNNSLSGSNASSTIDVTNGSTSIDLSRRDVLATLNITVHTPDGKPFPPRSQISASMTGSNSNISGQLNQEGTAAIDNLQPGDYLIRVSINGRAVSVLSLSLNGAPIHGKTVHVPNGAVEKLDVVASANLVSVGGFATRDQKPVAGSMVVLVPAGKDTSEDLFRLAQSDLDGGFSFDSVAPGNYLLVAINDGWKMRYTDLTVLRPFLPHALPVSVPDNGSKKMRLPDPALVQDLQ